MVNEEKDALMDNEAGDLHLIKYQILSNIRMKQKRIIKISKELEQDPCSVGRWCAEMEEKGLVTVKKDRRDRRAKLVAITPYGASVYKSSSPSARNI